MWNKNWKQEAKEMLLKKVETPYMFTEGFNYVELTGEVNGEAVWCRCYLNGAIFVK